MSPTNAAAERHPDRVLILADDLTGTLDAVAGFAGGHPAPFVGFSLESVRQAPAAARCVAINTNTRHASPSEARRVVRDLSRWGVDHGRTVFFKKTDSTLRGNIGPELAGLLDALGPSQGRLIFAPAFPEAGRTVRHGHLALDGTPIHQTSLAHDPRSPVRDSCIRSLLAEQLPLGRHHLTCAPSDARASQKWFSRLPPGCHVLDATTPAELEEIALSLAAVTDRPLLLAGSAGLGKHLPAVIGSDEGEHADATMPAGPALILHGSVTPRSREQIARFKGRGSVCLEIGPEWLWESPGERDEFEGRWRDLLGQALAGKRSILVHTSSLSAAADSAPFAAWGRTQADYAREAPAAVAKVGRQILEAASFEVLVLGGGETAQAAIEALGVEHGTALGEVFIGVNRFRTQALGRCLDVVTKSGGMGPENLYEHFLP